MKQNTTLQIPNYFKTFMKTTSMYYLYSKIKKSKDFNCERCLPEP